MTKEEYKARKIAELETKMSLIGGVCGYDISEGQ